MIGSYEYRSSESLSRHHAHYVYDDLSRLTEVYQTVNYKVGSLESYEDEIRVRYEYNRAGELARVFYTTGAYTAGTQLLYDEFFRITSKDQTFGIAGTNLFRISASYTYVNISGRGTTPMVESYTSCVKTEGGQTLSNTTYRYTYDSNGNITAIRDASNAVVAQYLYDTLGQLTQEINVPLNRRYVWTYDDAGNILSKKTYNKNSGALIETQNYTYTTGSWGDLLTSVGSNTIEYDSIGNPTMWGQKDGSIWYNGAILEWQGRELQSFQAFRENDDGYLDADYAIYFTYNADGIRTEKNTDLGNHEYILNGDQIVGEWIGGRTTLIVYLYDEAGAPIGMKIHRYGQAEGVFDEYFFEKNLQGDIVAVYNLDGEKIGAYTYDAWGNFTITLASTNTTAENNIVNTYNPFRYRGYYYDVETGLYYLQSRYYNPAWGRFINADSYVSTGQGFLGNNMFAYCGNNPVNRADPMGQFWGELWNAFTQTIQQASAYFAIAAGISQVDTPAPGPADVVSGVLLLAGFLVCAGIATYNTITAPAPSISIPKYEVKDEVFPAPPTRNGTTYYHVTTPDNAAAIAATGIMTGSNWEGGYVYAWKTKPSQYAIENSGAHMGVIISFITDAAFVMDTGITDPKVQMYGPVVSAVPGPIVVSGVQIVG